MSIDENNNEEGLADYYDLVVYGTGFIPSIISCAAAKVGKSVMHLDRNEFYGDEDYSTFVGLSAFTASNSDEKSIDESIDGPLHKVIEFVDYTSSDLVINNQKNKWNSSSIHPSCFHYQMEKLPPKEADLLDMKMHHPSFCGYLKHNELTTNRASTAAYSRDYNIDMVSPRLLHASGKLIDWFINSGASNYLEFKSLEEIHLLDEEATWVCVPRSKTHVFISTDLTAKEKRSLMKLQQAVTDAGRGGGAAVYCINDTDLSTTGSLLRPQNKRSDPGLGSLMQSEKYFHSFLLKSGLTPRLSSLVLYGMCLSASPQEYTTNRGVQDLTLLIGNALYIVILFD